MKTFTGTSGLHEKCDRMNEAHACSGNGCDEKCHYCQHPARLEVANSNNSFESLFTNTTMAKGAAKRIGMQASSLVQTVIGQ